MSARLGSSQREFVYERKPKRGRRFLLVAVLTASGLEAVLRRCQVVIRNRSEQPIVAEKWRHNLSRDR